jgi:hypothetical protein
VGEEQEQRVGVSWVQVAGSALAAVSSAVVLSTLGVAGTVIGAAVGSVVATVGSSLYTRTLDVSRQQVAAQTAALRRVTQARSELEEVVAGRARGGGVSSSGITRAGRQLDEAEEVLVGGTDGVSPVPAFPDQRVSDDTAGSSDVRRSGTLSASQHASSTGSMSRGLAARLSWKRLAVLAATVFLVTMVAITGFELLAGQAVSDLTGGSDTPKSSTVPGLGRPHRAASPSDGATPNGDASPSSTPSGDPTSAGSPSTDVTPSPSAGSTPTPTATPTPSPSPELTESPTPLPSSTPTGATGG